MKNRRWMNGKRMAMCLCGLMTWFFVMPAMAVDQNAPGKAKLKVETKTITRDSAAALIASGEKITLGVYLVLDKDWESALKSGALDRVEGMMSFGFFEDVNYTPSNFLQNPVDYIEICADEGAGTSGYMAAPRSTCCTNPTKSSNKNWYATVDWQKPGAKDGVGGTIIGWPDYAYGNLYERKSTPLYPQEDRDYYTYWAFKDGVYEFKLFEIQFKLKSIGNRSAFPVAILDDGVQVQGALGATELNIMTGNNKYWPSGAPAKPDWTDLVGTYFDFVKGGLFIETGPEVETFEPSF